MAHDALATLRDLTYKGGPEATHYLLRALATLGRTNALVGQHIGLNAMSSYYATKLPRCEQVFKEGEVVLLEGMALAREAGDRPAAALTLSCLAELLYCAASANTHGARALVQPHQQGLVSSVAELTRRSIAGSLEAIRILREDGEGRHARNLARIMKVRAVTAACCLIHPHQLYMWGSVCSKVRRVGRPHRTWARFTTSRTDSASVRRTTQRVRSGG
jgi:hypothetical protein